MRRVRHNWITLDSGGNCKLAHTAAGAGCKRAVSSCVDGSRPWSRTMAWKWLRFIRS